MKKDFLELVDFSSNELEELISLASEMKKEPAKFKKSLDGKVLGMIFSKNSTRTRVSFQTGIFQLGGTGLFFGASDLQLSRGESISDTAKVLSRYLDGIMIRTFDHQDILDLAKHASIPIINGLTDYNHPCQIMADILTIKEKFQNLKGRKLTYVGDGNNVTLSLMYGCIKFGLDFCAVSPKNYQLENSVIKTGLALAKSNGVTVSFTDSLEDGLKGASVIYGDTFTSMGQEQESKKRLADLSSYKITDEVFNFANKDAIYMHCLPAHRGEEVEESVIDGARSVIFDQAENRLHAQKAVMYTLMKD